MQGTGTRQDGQRISIDGSVMETERGGRGPAPERIESFSPLSLPTTRISRPTAAPSGNRGTSVTCAETRNAAQASRERVSAAQREGEERSGTQQGGRVWEGGGGRRRTHVHELELRGVEAEEPEVVHGVAVQGAHGDLLPVQEDCLCNQSRRGDRRSVLDRLVTEAAGGCCGRAVPGWQRHGTARLGDDGAGADDVAIGKDKACGKVAAKMGEVERRLLL